MPTLVRDVIRSGVSLFDDWLAGMRAGGIHLLTGGPGSGKTTAALHFADAGLRSDESVAMLVHARADDVKSQATHFGVDLDGAVRDGQLLLLRFRSNFVERAAQAVSPRQVVDDLERLIAPRRPTRIVIDSFSPFVAGAPPVGPMVVALVEFLEQSGATSLLTFPEELAAGYDRNLEPLVQSAAAVIRLARGEGDVRRAELLSLRRAAGATSSTRFVIRPGVGIVAEHPPRLERLAVHHPHGMT